jgi:hypothetical protein
MGSQASYDPERPPCSPSLSRLSRLCPRIRPGGGRTHEERSGFLTWELRVANCDELDMAIHII